MKYNFKQSLVEEDLDQEFDKLKDAIKGIIGELHIGYKAFDDAVTDGVVDEDGTPLEDKTEEEIAQDIYDDLTIDLENDEVDGLASQAAEEAGEAISEELNDSSFSKYRFHVVDDNAHYLSNPDSPFENYEDALAAVEEIGGHVLRVNIQEEGIWDHKNAVIKYLKDHEKTLTSDFKETMRAITKMLMPDFSEEELSADHAIDEIAKVDAELEESAAITVAQKKFSDERRLRGPLAEFVLELKTKKTDAEITKELAKIFLGDRNAKDEKLGLIKRLVTSPTVKTAEKVLRVLGTSKFDWKTSVIKYTGPLKKWLGILTGGLVEAEAAATSNMGSYVPDVKLSEKPIKRVRPSVAIEKVKDAVSKAILKEAIARKKAGTLSDNLCTAYNKMLSPKGKLALATLTEENSIKL